MENQNTIFYDRRIEYKGKTLRLYCLPEHSGLNPDGSSFHVINSEEVGGPFSECGSCSESDFESTVLRLILSFVKHVDGKIPPEPRSSFLKLMKASLLVSYRKLVSWIAKKM